VILRGRKFLWAERVSGINLRCSEETGESWTMQMFRNSSSVLWTHLNVLACIPWRIVGVGIQLQTFLTSTPDSDERTALRLGRLIPHMKGNQYPRKWRRVDPREDVNILEMRKVCTLAELCTPNRPHCTLLYLRIYIIFLLVFFFALPIWQRILKGISKFSSNWYKYVRRQLLKRSACSVISLILIFQILQISVISPVHSLLKLVTTLQLRS
jgi:hypothetical protein